MVLPSAPSPTATTSNAPYQPVASSARVMVVIPLASTASEGRGKKAAKTGAMCSLKSVPGRGARSKTGGGGGGVGNTKAGPLAVLHKKVGGFKPPIAMATTAGYKP
jgi:hypothetical protein